MSFHLLNETRGGGRCLQGKCSFNHHCQYDVTLHASDFQDGGRSGNRKAI